MIPISETIVTNTIIKFKKEIDDIENDVVNNIKLLLKDKKDKIIGNERKYLSFLLANIKKVITGNHDDLAMLKVNFNGFIAPDIMKGKSKETFRNKILSALCYKELRTTFYPKYFNAIGIKACVYCNSQLTVSVESNEFYTARKQKGQIKKKIIKAKFQVDHNLPKSEYPCFSISLFNLYPTCAACNNSKSTTNVIFSLYSSDKTALQNSSYQFELEKGSVANYILHKDVEKIKIIFNDPLKKDRKIEADGSFFDTFDIEGIYQTQKDLVEELIAKAMIYDDAYKRTLIKSFKKIFNDANLSNRVLIGNYIYPDEIHKRPMAKFTQDIAKQLKLI